MGKFRAGEGKSLGLGKQTTWAGDLWKENMGGQELPRFGEVGAIRVETESQRLGRSLSFEKGSLERSA